MVETLCHPELVSGSISKKTPKRVRGDREVYNVWRNQIIEYNKNL